MTPAAVSSGWEALSADPLPWLLDDERPNLVARVLVELIGRPPTSPAVVRARGGANAADPVATLLAPLQPDGTWAPGVGVRWGPGEPMARIVAATQLGADHGDPRLQAAVTAWLDEERSDGPVALGPGSGEPAPWRTARAVEALCALGWSRHLGVQEALAWLEEAAPSSSDGGWSDSHGGECAATAAAVLSATTSADGPRRQRLWERALASADRLLGSGAVDGAWTMPRFDRSDVLELLWSAARAGAPWNPEWRPAIETVQDGQDRTARWSARRDPPLDAVLVGCHERSGEPSGWLTLEAVGVMLRYAPDAGLPRRFPERPGA